MELNAIYNEDCRKTIKRLSDQSINCIVTSPPYWALRDYGLHPITFDDGWRGSLGLEPDFNMYISHLVGLFSKMHRILRNDGALWVNLGDSYSGAKTGNTDSKNNKANTQSFKKLFQNRIKDKSLIGIPERFKIAMIDMGWICRNTIIWHKPNCMPSSARDRFTVDFEYLYFFTKNKNYFFDRQFEPQTGNTRSSGKKLSPPIESAGIGHKDWHKYTPNTVLPQGRMKRCVWTIPTTPFSGAHFATFPEKLIEIPIQATCPKDVCVNCGKPREKIYKYTGNDCNGYTDCGCDAGFKPGVVYDPFMGSGTVKRVAIKQGKNYIGSELSKDYCNIEKDRNNSPVPLFERE